MALTTKEREILNKELEKIINKYADNETVFYNSDVIDDLTPHIDFIDKVTTQALSRCIRNICTGKLLHLDPLYTNRGRRAYTIRKVVDIIKDSTVKKQKNILYFNTDNGKITYDFITKTFSINPYSNGVIGCYNLPYSHTLTEMLEYEWVFNYCSNLKDIEKIVNSDIFEYAFKKKCPKNLVAYLDGKELTKEKLRDYYKNIWLDKNEKSILEHIFSNNIEIFVAVTSIVPSTKIIKMVRNDMQNFNLSSLDNRKRLMLNMVNALKKLDNNVSLLDMNRGLQFNANRLTELLEAEKNKTLTNKMQKINMVHNFSKDNLQVIVPQTQKEKQEEGKMQNNCVGYYYDDSILRNENYIYFIRLKNSLQKSYVTCRYNTRTSKTVEARMKNNRDVTDETVFDFIKEIDEIITNNL